MRKILFAKGVDEFTNVNYYINAKEIHKCEFAKEKEEAGWNKSI